VLARPPGFEHGVSLNKKAGESLSLGCCFLSMEVRLTCFSKQHEKGVNKKKEGEKGNRDELMASRPRALMLGRPATLVCWACIPQEQSNEQESEERWTQFERWHCEST
jgi:hypothetical protein